MIKRILVATSLLCMCCILFAQTVQVKGKVVSENEAVEFANVVLQTKDSIFIAGGVTDSKGRFMMENIQQEVICFVFPVWDIPPGLYHWII